MEQFSWLILAIALLTTSPEEPNTSQANVVAMPYIKAMAIKMEIMDKKESHYILMRPDEFQSDMMMLRTRYDSLKGMPMSSDALRYPERERVNEMLSFNREYQQYLISRQSISLSEWWEYEEAINETENLFQIWSAVSDSRCEYYYISVRREALARLRNLIGEGNYYSGQLPPNVPIWRFEEIP